MGMGIVVMADVYVHLNTITKEIAQYMAVSPSLFLSDLFYEKIMK